MSNELVGIALVGGLLWGGIAFAMLPSAVDSEYDSKQAYNINHKYDNLDNQADLDDNTIYEASDKAKTIKQANESLKRIKGWIMSTNKVTKKDRITHLELQVGWLTNVVHELRGTENLEFNPKLKQLDQSIFNGLDEKWRFAAVDKNGSVYKFRFTPKVSGDSYFCDEGYHKYSLVGTDYDTSNWQNSLIERDTAKELTGSELCKAMLARGDKYVMCAVSDDGEEDTLLDGYYVAVSSIGFRGVFETYDHNWVHATPINNQGEPLTAAEAGFDTYRQ